MGVCGAINILLKYNWHLNPTDNEIAIDLGLQSVKKYLRYTTQVTDKFSHVKDFFPTLAVFVNKARIDYDQKMQLDKHLWFK